MPEMIDVYNADRTPAGFTKARKEKLEPGQYMLYVLALIKNKDDRFLITRRSLDKKWAAGAWEIPGGGAEAGETSLQAVCREVREENSLDISDCDPKVIYSYRNDDEKHGDNYFADIYLCTKDFTLSDVKVQEDEVIDVKLATLDDIRELYEKDDFLHYKRICEALNA